MESQCYAAFVRSEHFSYILELKGKEGVVPGLPDFRLLRVLGQGGFGQVLEVVKRDCGKRCAPHSLSPFVYSYTCVYIYICMYVFRLLRVLGQGGFEQVLEVVKRDCGKRCAQLILYR